MMTKNTERLRTFEKSDEVMRKTTKLSPCFIVGYKDCVVIKINKEQQNCIR